jgi:hypothetical protein
MRVNPLIHMPFANVASRVGNTSVAVIILGAYLLFVVMFLAFVSTHS